MIYPHTVRENSRIEMSTVAAQPRPEGTRSLYAVAYLIWGPEGWILGSHSVIALNQELARAQAYGWVRTKFSECDGYMLRQIHVSKINECDLQNLGYSRVTFRERVEPPVEVPSDRWAAAPEK